MTSLTKDLDAQLADSQSRRRHVWIRSSILKTVINNQEGVQQQQGDENEIIDQISSLPKNSNTTNNKKGRLIKSFPSIRAGITKSSSVSSLFSRPSFQATTTATTPKDDDSIDTSKISVDTHTTYGDTDYSTIGSKIRADYDDAAASSLGWGWVLAVILLQTDDIITILVDDKDCTRCDNMMIEIPTTVIQDGDLVDDDSSSRIDDEHGSNGRQRRRPVADDNLIQLSNVNQPSIVHHLRKRYDDGQIHTLAGPTLLMIVNPFTRLNSEYYSLEAINKYWTRGMERDQQQQQQQLLKEEEQQHYLIHDDKYNTSTALGPHVFGTADLIFRNMTKKALLNKRQITNTKNGNTESPRISGSGSSMTKQLLNNNNNNAAANQSIIINGASASGKTVTAKLILSYLTVTSDRRYNSSTSSSTSNSITGSSISSSSLRTPRSNSSALQSSLGRLQQKILSIGTILESYGHARTRTNDNSSRFASVVTLNYDTTTVGDGGGAAAATTVLMMVGATITTIFFEKERVTSQGDGERNFHIFYEMMNGVNSNDDDDDDSALSQQRARLFHLRSRNGTTATTDGGYLNPDDFKITSCSGTYDRRDGVDDDKRFRALLMAMETLGMEGRERDRILMATAAILHLGNLSFDVVGRNRCKLATEQTNASFKSVLSLLGVDYEMLNDALCYTYAETSTTNKRQLNVVQSMVNLEALTKGLFHAIFNYLIDRINELINVDNDDDDKTREMGLRQQVEDISSISIVDMFEFNSFQYNSFDQFCTNYCKEVLQQQFIQDMLKNRQNEYIQEEIMWDLISYRDNLDLLNLIDDDVTGIISSLETASQQTAANTNDDSNKKLLEQNLINQCHGRKGFLASPQQQKDKQEFVLEHYAGRVEYSITGFVEKNSRYRLSTKVIDMLYFSTQPFIKTLATRMNANHDVNISSGSGMSLSRSSASSSPDFVVGRLKRQLQDLRKKFDAATTSPYHIRCLKPNDKFRSDWFEPRLIDEQLRGTGIVEALRISHAGYPHRLPHTVFLERYKLLAPNGIPRRRSRLKNTKEICEAFINAFDDADLFTAGGDTSYQIGRTKIFLKDDAYDKIERLRRNHLTNASIVIQTNVREFLCRRKWQNTLRDLLEMQYLPRGYSQRLLVRLWRRKRAATTITKYFRRFVAKRRFEDAKRNVIMIQNAWRRYSSRRRRQQQSIVDERERLRNEVEQLRRELEISRRQSLLLNLDLQSTMSTQPSLMVRSNNNVDVRSSSMGGDISGSVDSSIGRKRKSSGLGCISNAIVKVIKKSCCI